MNNYQTGIYKTGYLSSHSVISSSDADTYATNGGARLLYLYIVKQDVRALCLAA